MATEQREVISIPITVPPQPKSSDTSASPSSITPPLLIPNENANAYCISRRNILDVIIAIVFACGVIYLVMYMRSNSSSPTEFASSLMSSTTDTVKSAPTTFAKPITDAASNINTGVNQMLGGFMRLFK